MKISNFALIIGAMKCGTTSLFNYLAQHPQISACSKKEPNFFCDERIFSQGFEYYQDLWDWNNMTHKVALEATPNYTRITNPRYSNAVNNIATVQKNNNINFKFIYIMRNPIDRIESHYTHALVRKKTKEIIKQPLSKKIDNETIDTSKYAMQIEEYYKIFPNENILLLNFEDLKTNPLDVVKKICVFLDIDPEHNFVGLNAIHNIQNIKIGLPGWYSIRETKLMQLIIKATSPEKRDFLKSIFGVRRNDYIRFSSEQKQYVFSKLKTDLQKLNLEYGVDVERWNF